MTSRNLMPIGRFARSCRLSVKALRHYAELGLLEPALVDPQTGYRYYAREQARAAVMIGMLRELDLPLPVIRRLLGADPESLSELLDGEAARLEAEVEARRRALLSVRHLAREGSLASDAVELREDPPRRVALLAGATTTDRLVPDTSELVYAALHEVRRAGLTPGAVGCLNDFQEQSEDVTIRAFVEVEADVPNSGRCRMETLPAATVAHLTHVGPYETLGLAYNALYAWTQERGHAVTETIREIYVNDPVDVDRGELITDVAIPVRGST